MIGSEEEKTEIKFGRFGHFEKRSRVEVREVGLKSILGKYRRHPVVVGDHQKQARKEQENRSSVHRREAHFFYFKRF